MTIGGWGLPDEGTRRFVSVIGIASLLAAGLAMVPASSAAAVSDPTAPVPAALESTAWRQHPAKAGGAYAARSVVQLAPGGTGVWGVIVTAGTEAIGAGANLVFTGLPPGMTAAPTQLPSSVPVAEVDSVSGCSGSAGVLSCSLSAGVPSGATRVVAVALTDAAGAPAGIGFEGQMQLVDSGSGQPASTPLRVDIQAGTEDSLYVYTDAPKLAKENEGLQRVMHVYNLGGGPKHSSAKSTVQMSKVLPVKVAKDAKVSGAGWSCNDGAGVGTCVWHGQDFVVGGATSPLTISHVLPAGSSKGRRAHGGPRNFSWVTRVSGDKGIAPTKHAQTLNIMAKEQDPTKAPKPKSRYLHVGHLNLSGSEMSQPRLGGNGRYLVMINNGGSKEVKSATVHLQVPGHARVIAAKSPGWRCSKSGVCANKAPIPAHHGAESIEFTIESRAGPRAGTKGVVAAVATWQGKGKDRRDRQVFTTDWHPALKVVASSHSEAIASDVPGLKGMLSATVDGLNGKKFGYKWRQLCPKGKAAKACPRVTWTGPVQASTDSSGITAAYLPPAVTKDTQLNFALTVSAGGASVRKRVSVVVVAPIKRISTAPGGGAKSKNPPALDRTQKLGKTTKPTATAWIGDRGPTHVKPGELKKLVVHVARRGNGSKVRKIAWLVNDEPADLLAGAKRRKHGRVLLLRVPPNVSGPLLLSAIVHHVNGSATVTSELLDVETDVAPSRLAMEPRSSRYPADASDAPSGSATPDGPQAAGTGQPPGQVSAQSSAFCDLFAAAQAGGLTSVTFDSIEMSLGQVTANGSDCGATNASIGFGNASVTINGIGLTGLTGAITASGLSINSGLLALPGGSGPPGLTGYTFSGSPALNIPFTAADLSGLNGTITLNLLPFLPAPKGWSVTASTLTFGPGAGGYKVSVKASASAPSPETGTAALTGTIGAGGAVFVKVSAVNVMPITGADGSTTLFTGSGTVTGAAGAPLTYAVNIAMVPPSSGKPFYLYGGVQLSGAALNWDDKGFSIAASTTVVLSMNKTTYSFAVSGTITDFGDWSITITAPVNLIKMEWLSIDQPSGTITSVRDPQTGIVTLSMDLSARAQFVPAEQTTYLNVTSTTAHLGIFCPGQAAQKNPSCANRTLQLQLDLVGTLGEAPLQATVDADINTGQFSVSVGIDNPPTDLEQQTNSKFNNVSVFYSNEPATDPALAGNPCMTSSQLSGADLVKGIMGSFSMNDFGSAGNFIAIDLTGGQASGGRNGWCLYGTFGSDGANAAVNMPDGTGSFLAGGVIFSQYGTNMNINDVWTPIAAYDVTMWGEYHLPTSINDKFKADAITATITAQIGDSGDSKWTLNASVDFQNAYFFGRDSSTSLQVKSAGILISKTSGYHGPPKLPIPPKGTTPGPPAPAAPTEEGGGAAPETAAEQGSAGGTDVSPSGKGKKRPPVTVPGVVTFGIDVQLALQVPGMASNGTPGSTGSGATPDEVTMPITGTITRSMSGLNQGTWTFSAVFGDGGQTTLNNAFGVQGLDINEIVIAAVWSPDVLLNWVGFAASVTTPSDDSSVIGKFTSVLGLQPNTPISLAFQISETSPCFGVTIGDPAHPKLAINGFWGMLQADYVELLIAPAACKIASFVPNMPNFGYAIDFDGSVFGAAANIHGLYAISLENKMITLDVDFDAFSLAGIDVTSDHDVACTGGTLTLEDGTTYHNLPNRAKGPCLSFEVDMITTSVDLTLSGAVNLWGGFFVGVSGGLHVNGGAANPVTTVNLTGTANLDLFGIFTQSASLTLDADFTLWTSESGAGWNPSFSTLDIAAAVPMDYYFIKNEITLAFDYEHGMVSLVYADFDTTVDLVLVEAGVDVKLAYCRPVTGAVTCAVSGNPADPGAVTQGDTDGNLNISASGMVGYWLFGWHTAEASILDLNIPVHFDNPVAPAPPTINYGVPAPPIKDWPNPTWTYQPEMFMNIGWDPGDLVNATGLDSSYATNGGLQYGAPVNDSSLTAPAARFDAANLEITNPTQSADGTTTTVDVVASLPETPTYKEVAGLHLPPARLAAALPAFGKCSGTQTETFSVVIPKWNDGHPLSSSSAALIIAEVNWRIYLGSVIETTSIAGHSTPAEILANYRCGFGMISGATAKNPQGSSSTDNWVAFPSLQTWLSTNKVGERFNLGYPQQPPTDSTQFCAPGAIPSTAYGAQCQTNIATGLNNAWGTGWGAGDSSGWSPPPG